MKGVIFQAPHSWVYTASHCEGSKWLGPCHWSKVDPDQKRSSCHIPQSNLQIALPIFAYNSTSVLAILFVWTGPFTTISIHIHHFQFSATLQALWRPVGSRLPRAGRPRTYSRASRCLWWIQSRIYFHKLMIFAYNYNRISRIVTY